MRKLITVTLFVIIFLVSFKDILADDKTADQYYQELLQNYRRYQNLVEPYNTQRSRYLSYQSVSSQADFLDASKKLISAEIETMNSYTNFVRTHLAEATRIINYKENYLYLMLDDELNFLLSTRKKVSSLSSLSDSQAFLKELSSRFKKITQTAYQIKSIIELGAANKTLENLKVETEKLQISLAEIEVEEAKIFAAREKFADLTKELQTAEGLLKETDGLLNNTPKDGDFYGVSKRIRNQVNQVADKFYLITQGYKNIVLSFK